MRLRRPRPAASGRPGARAAGAAIVNRWSRLSSDQRARGAASYSPPPKGRCSVNKTRAVLVVLGAVLVLLPAATASHTPAPLSVTVAGSLQSEAGCAGDWDPGCAVTHLTFDASDDVWQGTFTLPAGNYQYKAALNNTWDENYGRHAVPNGD